MTSNTIIVVLGAAVLMATLAGISKAVMDIIQHKFRSSIFSNKKRFNELFWNPEKSWRNKWRQDVKENTLKERFPGSSTFLVFVTDAWHLFQSSTINPLALSFFLLGIVANVIGSVIIGIVLFIAVLVLFKVVFEIFYSKVLIKKDGKQDK